MIAALNRSPAVIAVEPVPIWKEGRAKLPKGHPGRAPRDVLGETLRLATAGGDRTRTGQRAKRAADARLSHIAIAPTMQRLLDIPPVPVSPFGAIGALQHAEDAPQLGDGARHFSKITK